ncbi:MAG TPA: hypothetical protein DDW50_21110 [Firmicutes bacterium]|nr:hypothetical protein [Bacillota bacterium]
MGKQSEFVLNIEEFTSRRRKKGWNLSKTSKMTGISRPSLWKACLPINDPRRVELGQVSRDKLINVLGPFEGLFFLHDELQNCNEKRNRKNEQF